MVPDMVLLQAQGEVVLGVEVEAPGEVVDVYLL